MLSKVINMDEHKPAGPKLENGHIRIANELFDAILGFHFSGRQLAVLLAVVRKTYGYGKKEDDVSASQIGALCGVKRNHVTEALHQLAAMGVITLSRGSYGMLVGINKHHETWKKEAASPKSGLVPNRDVGSPKSGLKVVPNRDMSIVPNRDTQKTTFQKTTPIDNPKKIARSDDRAAFAEFWDAFGYKNGKAGAEKAFSALLASADDREATLAAVMRGAAKEKARRPTLVAKNSTPMYAQGWLSQRRFEDESLLFWGDWTEAQGAFVACFNENIGDAAPQVSEWSERTAALIDIAMTGKWSLEKWGQFWRFVRDGCEFRWPVSIDWILDRSNFMKIKDGQYAPNGGGE